MKKSLQRIAFGLSIIAASTGVMQSMQTPVTGSMVSSTTVDPATHSIMKVTRPLKIGSPPTEIDLASEGVDLSKVFVMDGESIIRGVIPETQQVSFLEMLANPTLAIAKFNEFLDISYFQEKRDSKWFITQEFAFRSFLIERSKLTKETLDDITLTLMITSLSLKIHSDSWVLSGTHKTHSDIDTEFQAVASKVEESPTDSSRTEKMLLIQPLVHAYFEEYTKNRIKNPSEYREKLRTTVNSAIVEDSAFREAMVSFLAAFESKKITNPEFKAIFGNRERFGIGIVNENFFVIHLLPNGKKTTYITAPFLLKKLSPLLMESSAFDLEDHSYRYSIYHELGGHITTKLLLSDHFESEQEQGSISLTQDIPDLQSMDIPITIRDLLFAEGFFEVNADRFVDPSISGSLEKAKQQVIRETKLLQHHLWTDRSELFQISGLYFYDGKIIVNKLSDFNFAVSNKIPFRWWHAIIHPDSFGGFQLMKDLLPHTLTEPQIQKLFYLHESDYVRYKTDVLDS